MFHRNEITDPNSLPTRKAYPWGSLEEFFPNGGMWQIPSAHKREYFIHAAADLMANPVAFHAAMRQALTKWPNSCENAFTTPGLNHRAWIGHAGCFLATGSPEETTRLGWHELDDGEQYGANAAADDVIAEWRRLQRPTNQDPLW